MAFCHSAFRIGVTVKLFVVGATGRTGSLVVRQALERGHGVTAFGARTWSGSPIRTYRSRMETASPSAISPSSPGTMRFSRSWLRST